MYLTLEVGNQPGEHPLFPLSIYEISETAERFESMSPEEINLLNGNNLGVLPDTDPRKYLLELRGRPEIVFPEDPEQLEPRVAAYRAGVGLGSLMVRYKIYELRHAGYADLPEPEFDPSNPPKLPPLHVKKSIAGEDSDPADALYTKYTPARDLFPFLRDPGSIEDLEHLKYVWMKHEHSFLANEAREQSIDDFFMTGILDAFTVYASIYGYSYKNFEDKSGEKSRSARSWALLAAAALYGRGRRGAARAASIMRGRIREMVTQEELEPVEDSTGTR